MAGYSYRWDGRKTGLDPLFGLPATRDSKAMDSARTRNISYGKQLQSFLKSLDKVASVKNVKIITRQAKTKEMLDKINPDPDKKIVTPMGLNEEQVKTVRILRRGSLPSMTIQELDQRLSSLKLERGKSISDTWISEKSRKNSKSKFAEYKIKRKLYRGNSKTKQIKQNSSTSVVDDKSTTTLLPLYHRKNLVSEAYQRITSSDIVHARARDHESQKRCASDSDISLDSLSTMSNNKCYPPEIVDRKRAPPARRNTVSDITCDLTQARRVHFERVLNENDEQQMSNQNDFENFLRSIKQGDKLPAL